VNNLSLAPNKTGYLEINNMISTFKYYTSDVGTTLNFDIIEGIFKMFLIVFIILFVEKNNKYVVFSAFKFSGFNLSKDWLGFFFFFFYVIYFKEWASLCHQKKMKLFLEMQLDLSLVLFLLIYNYYSYFQFFYLFVYLLRKCCISNISIWLLYSFFFIIFFFSFFEQRKIPFC
jgi:hypothetical protein